MDGRHISRASQEGLSLAGLADHYARVERTVTHGLTPDVIASVRPADALFPWGLKVYWNGLAGADAATPVRLLGGGPPTSPAHLASLRSLGVTAIITCLPDDYGVHDMVHGLPLHRYDEKILRQEVVCARACPCAPKDAARLAANNFSLPLPVPTAHTGWCRAWMVKNDDRSNYILLDKDFVTRTLPLQFPTRVHVPLADHVDTAIPAAVEAKIVEAIAVARASFAEGGSVYVHCWMGWGRTGLVTAAILAGALSLPADVAMTRVNAAHMSPPFYRWSPHWTSFFATPKPFDLSAGTDATVSTRTRWLRAFVERHFCERVAHAPTPAPPDVPRTPAALRAVYDDLVAVLHRPRDNDPVCTLTGAHLLRMWRDAAAATAAEAAVATPTNAAAATAADTAAGTAEVDDDNDNEEEPAVWDVPETQMKRFADAVTACILPSVLRRVDEATNALSYSNEAVRTTLSDAVCRYIVHLANGEDEDSAPNKVFAEEATFTVCLTYRGALHRCTH